MRLIPTLLALGLTLATAAPLAAQGDFSPAIKVNDSIVTGHELDQRIRFLTLLQFPGDIQAEAEKGLIEDRLRLAEARTMGIAVSDEQLQAGMAEFAGRANLDTEQFLAAIGQGGVEPESFRDFVRAGIAWREVVRARFAQRIPVSQAEIERALTADHGRGAGPRVLLSEIYLPARQGAVGKSRRLAEDLAESIQSEAGFAEAARTHSGAASRAEGGRVGWVALANLPPQVRGAIGTLGQGQVSAPVPLPDAIGLFMVHAFEEGADKVAPGSMVVDYALFTLPAAGAQAEAARLDGQVDTCDDLYRVARGLPADRLTRAKARRAQIPGDIGAALDRLDPNEAALVPRGAAAAYVMLCSRTATLADGYIDPAFPTVPGPEAQAAAAVEAPPLTEGWGLGFGPTREQVRDEIINRKAAQLAEGYLAELKANAIITRP